MKTIIKHILISVSLTIVNTNFLFAQCATLTVSDATPNNVILCEDPGSYNFTACAGRPINFQITPISSGATFSLNSSTGCTTPSSYLIDDYPEWNCTFNTPGSTISLTITYGSPCNSSVTVNIYIRDIPVPNIISVTPLDPCSNNNCVVISSEVIDIHRQTAYTNTDPFITFDMGTGDASHNYNSTCATYTKCYCNLTDHGPQYPCSTSTGIYCLPVGIGDGSYTIVLTATNMCGSASASQQVLAGADWWGYWDHSWPAVPLSPGSHLWTSSANPFQSNSSVIRFNGEMHITSGYDITIEGMTFQFGADSRVIIEPGGKLTLRGTTFTGSVDCQTMWQGIEVQGAQPASASLTAQGRLYMIDDISGNHSRIENAITGIALQHSLITTHDYDHLGGYINLDGAVFNNNLVSISMIDPNPVASYTSAINNCQFTGTAPYLWEPHIGDRPQKFINIYNYTGTDVVFLNNNGTHNSFTDGGTGINCLNTQQIDLSDAHFTSLDNGIYSTQSSAAITTSGHNFNQCEFTNTHTAFRLIGTKGVEIMDCDFNLSQGDQDDNFYGILLGGTAGAIDISGNEFWNMKYAIYTEENASDFIDIYNNSFKYCWRGISTVNDQTPMRVKCNEFRNDVSSINYSAAWCIVGPLSDQLGQAIGGAGNSFFNIPPPPQLPPRRDIVSAPGTNQWVNFKYYTWNNGPIHRPEVTTTVNRVDLTQAMPGTFCSSPPQLMELADGDPDVAKDIIDGTTNSIQKQIYVNDLVQWYKEQNQNQNAIDYLEERNDEPAKKMVLPLYIELSQYSNAQSLLDEYNDENDDEGYNYYLLNQVVLDWAESSRDAYGMDTTERTTLEEVGETETSSADLAKNILRFVFDTVFTESEYSDTSLFRFDYYPKEGLPMFTIIPNPASGNCIVRFALFNKNDAAAMKFFDVTGRLLKQWELEKGSKELFIDTRIYSDGVYVMEFSQGIEITEKQKLVIQNQK